MSKKTPEMWDEMARQYRAGIAVGVIAQTFKVARVRIRLQAEQFSWTRDPAEAGDAASSEESSGASPEPRTPAAHPVADAHRMLLDRHRAAWMSVHDLGDEVFRILRGEEPQIFKRLHLDSAEERMDFAAKVNTLYEKRAKALMITQEGERRAYGLDYKQQQEAQQEDEAQARRRRELTASVVDLISRLARTRGVDSSDTAS
jgi:hypothetical protein